MGRPSFATLPPELRYMIYLLATPPRYVYLRGRQDNPFLSSSRVYFTSGTQIPALLHTCRESRNYLIKQGYELTFQTPRCEQRTWFNYNKDILIVPRLSISWSRLIILPIPATIELRYSVDNCRLHYLRVEDKDRIRWVAQCSRDNIHCVAQLGASQGSGYQRGRFVSEFELEPTVWPTSCLSWWPDPNRRERIRVETPLQTWF